MPSAEAVAQAQYADAFFWIARVLTTNGSKLDPSSHAMIAERIAALAASRANAGGDVRLACHRLVRVGIPYELATRQAIWTNGAMLPEDVAEWELLGYRVETAYFLASSEPSGGCDE